MKKSNVNTYWGATALSAGLLLTLPGEIAAQQSASAAAMLEEVVVTARRREESLQDLPLSIAAVTADQMQAQGIYDIMDVSESVPNLTFTGTARRGINAVYIRGIGSDAAISLTPSGTGTYVDGHYLPNTIGNMMSTVDVARIEVLRGPQGTLFGKNTTGGAINIVSVKPQPEFGADFLIRLGEHGQNDMRGMLNVPFSDTVAARFSAAKETYDGHYYNRIRQEHVGETDLEAYSAAVRITPNENWTIDLAARGNFQDDGQDPGTCNTAIPPALAAQYGYTGPNIDPNGVPRWGGGIGHVERIYPGATVDFWDACETDVAMGDYVTSTDRRTYMELDNINYSATINWDSAGAVGGLDNLSAQLAYSTHSTDINYMQDRDYTWLGIDQQALPPEAGGASSGQGRETDSLELLFTLDFSESVSLVTGVHLFSDVATDGDGACLRATQANLALLSDPLSGFSIECPADGATQFGRLTNAIDWQNGPGTGSKSGIVDNESTAVFGHLSWDINEAWTLDAGARWTEDTRNFDSSEWPQTGPCTIPGANMQVPLSVSICNTPRNILSYDTVFANGFYNDVEETFDKITPMVSITRHFDDGNLIYGTISTGFLSGSFNDELNTILKPELAPLQSYLPETVTNYEVGFKGAFADGRVRIAADIFYMDYQDKQEVIDIDNSDQSFGTDTDISITTNAATVQITGIELELRASLWDGGFVSFDVGYLHDEYGDWTSFNPEDPGSPLDLTNTSRTTYSPEWTMNASIEHAFQLGNGGTLTPMLGLYYQSEYDYHEQLVDSPPSFCNQPAYSKLRARLTYVDPSETWQASLYGYNIADERYYEYCGASRTGTYGYRWGAPAQWGMEFAYSF